MVSPEIVLQFIFHLSFWKCFENYPSLFSIVLKMFCPELKQSISLKCWFFNMLIFLQTELKQEYVFLHMSIFPPTTLVFSFYLHMSLFIPTTAYYRFMTCPCFDYFVLFFLIIYRFITCHCFDFFSTHPYAYRLF